MKYNKLIRDRIVEIMERKGLSFSTRVASDEEFWEKLKDKLLEEVQEFMESESIEEMADIFEVITTINALKGWDIEEVVEVQKSKREERGAFHDRIILDEVQD